VLQDHSLSLPHGHLDHGPGRLLVVRLSKGVRFQDEKHNNTLYRIRVSLRSKVVIYRFPSAQELWNFHPGLIAPLWQNKEF
jgi:hypothetical protein